MLAPITARKSETERRIELITSGVVEMWSLDNQDAGRGRKYKRVACDEVALVSNMLDIWNASIRPTLVDYSGDAWFGSTPKGHNGFWQMYQWGADPEQPDWGAWKFTTYDNPYIDPAEVDAMRRTMPERIFQQEVMAEFLDDAGGVFRRVMEAATVTALDAALPGHQYIAGVDVASLVDFTVVTILDAASKELVYMDRFNRTDYPTLYARLEAAYKRFNVTNMIVEANSIGQPTIDALRERNLMVTAFTTTAGTKQAIIQGLQTAFENGEIRIVSDPVLIGELQAFEATRTATGFKYSAPEGMHDDTVMSLAIAWSGVSSQPWTVW